VRFLGKSAQKSLRSKKKQEENQKKIKENQKRKGVGPFFFALFEKKCSKNLSKFDRDTLQ